MITRFFLVALMMPGIAVAQGNPGPYGKLFGRAPATRSGESGSTIELRSSAGGFYDTTLFPPEGAPDSATQQAFGTGATAGLRLDHKSSRFNASVSGDAGRLHYFTVPSYSVNYASGSATLSSALTTRIRLDGAVSYAHSPFFQLRPTVGIAADANANADASGLGVPSSAYAAQMLDNESVEASAGLRLPLTKTSSVSASAFHRQTMFAHSDADLVANGYQALWSWQIGKGLGVRAGYGRDFEQQQGIENGDFQNEVIDVGVDFNRALSLSRHTTLGFSTSTSFVKTGNTDRQFRLNGSVVLAKLFRRTWQASAYFSRETSFIPGLFEPVFSDAVGTSLGGMFSKRLDWSFQASAGKGESALSHTSGFNNATAGSRLTLAINKYLGLYGQYTAYTYEMPSNSNVLGLAEHLARQAVSIGLNGYLPVFNTMGQRK